VVFARLGLVAVAAMQLAGCCCCGDPAPLTDAELRVLAGPDPLVIKVDGKQEASVSAYSAATIRVLPGHHDVVLEAAGRPLTTGIDVKIGDDVFLGGHDTSCFAIVENPAAMGASPRWDLDKGPIPTTWSLVKELKPGEVWPEGETLSHVTDHAGSIAFSMSDRVAAPVPCGAADPNVAITAGVTEVVGKLEKF
jgi:hypothetical protein